MSQPTIETTTSSGARICYIHLMNTAYELAITPTLGASIKYVRSKIANFGPPLPLNVKIQSMKILTNGFVFAYSSSLFCYAPTKTGNEKSKYLILLLVLRYFFRKEFCKNHELKKKV